MRWDRADLDGVGTTMAGSQAGAVWGICRMWMHAEGDWFSSGIRGGRARLEELARGAGRAAGGDVCRAERCRRTSRKMFREEG